MACLIITKLKGTTYDTWKEHYDAGEPLRREFHVRAITVLRDAEDPNAVTVLTRFDSVQAAKAMLASDRWRELAKHGTALPEITVTEIADEKTY